MNRKFILQMVGECGFARPELTWKVMAVATTFAGNLTILD